MSETLKQEIKDLNNLIEAARADKSKDDGQVETLKQEIKDLNNLIEAARADKSKDDGQVETLKQEIKVLQTVKQSILISEPKSNSPNNQSNSE